jgi:hypothetical protein
MPHTWTTRPDWTVQVDGEVPLLSGWNLDAFRQRVLARWGELADRAALAAGVPPSWVKGVIWAESGGDPNAVSPAGAVGLMQLHSEAARQGHNFEQVKDPELNVRLGAQYLRTVYGPNSPTLPHVASRYNAGQRADGSPHPASNAWGMRYQGDYIDRVVAANNTAILDGSNAGGSAGGDGFGLLPFRADASASVGAELALERLEALELAVAELAHAVAELGAELRASRDHAARVLQAALEAARGTGEH